MKSRRKNVQIGSLTAFAASAEQFEIVDEPTRSRMMAAVRQTDTKPELAVRRLLRSLGVSYRIRNRDLPGSPDIANRSRRWAVFVNGCFWHGHKNCRKTKSTTSARVPKTRAEFWSRKLNANRARDARRCSELRQIGYRVLIVWECQLNQQEATWQRLNRFCMGRKKCRKASH